MRTALLMLAAMQVFALSNAIVIHDASGAAQSSRPYTVLMLFMQGEFPSGTYPKPRINGAAAAAWQADVKSRWPDGSVLSAFVSFLVTLSANGSAVVDFVPDVNACHLGGQSACEAAALNQAGMLNFMSGGWNAQIRGTANSISYTVDAKTMIANGDWQYWLRGPVVTRVIVRKNGFDYDFGWQWDGSNWQAPSSDTYRSVHPMFELSFYPGWNGVETGFRVENAWWTKLQTLKLKLEFLAGNPATPVYAKTNYDLEAKAASSYYAWSGAEPGAVVVDRNLPYLVATRILPPYDTTIQLDSATLSTFLSRWPANVGTDDAGRPDPRSCTTQNPCAYIKVDMPGTGDSDNFGILPRFQLFYLYAMGDSRFSVATRKEAFDKLVVGSGDAAVTISVHYRESITGATPDSRNYLDWPDDQTTPAFGRIKSISAHPDARCNGYDNSGAYPAQYICPSCPPRTHTWTYNPAHWPSLFSLPYILTGRWTYLMSLQESAASWIAYDHPDYARHQGWGIQYVASEPRIAARPLRELMWAFLLSPDSPEKQYFAGKLKNNDAAYEGVFDVRDGLYADQVRTDCRGALVYTGSVTFNGSHTLTPPNGQRKVFALDGWARLYSVTSMTLNGQAQTFGVYGQDTGRQWYWVPGTHLIVQDASGAPLSSTDSLVVNFQYGRSATPWCNGYAGMRDLTNPLPVIGRGSMMADGEGISGATGTSPWMVSYLAMHIGWARQTRALAVNGGYLFAKSGAKLGRYYIDGMLHPSKPALYNGAYRTVTTDALGLVTTWERFIAARNPPIALTTDITGSSTSLTFNCKMGAPGCPNTPSNSVIKIDDEYIATCGKTVGTSTTTFTVCAGGRGYWGSKAAAHTTASTVNVEWRVLGGALSGHTYPNLWVNALATFYDVDGILGSGLEAYQRVIGMGSGLQLRATDQRYALVPRVEPYRLKVFTSADRAEIHYLAPTLAACRYAVTSSYFPAPDDAGDELDRGGPRTRRIVLTGLTPGTYRYRVTCGAGRLMGTFTIPAVP
ncbi:MAG: hypothetical protein ACOYX1_01945 [Acidobacteriota bacterium]